MNCSASIPIPFPRRFASQCRGMQLRGQRQHSQDMFRKGPQYIPGIGTKRPNPALSAGFFWLTEGNSSYNALQVDVTHRMSKGLEFRGNYTWSKNLDMNSALTGAQANNQAQMVLDRNDLHRDWGPSALNLIQPGQHFRDYELPLAMDSAG